MIIFAPSLRRRLSCLRISLSMLEMSRIFFSAFYFCLVYSRSRRTLKVFNINYEDKAPKIDRHFFLDRGRDQNNRLCIEKKEEIRRVEAKSIQFQNKIKKAVKRCIRLHGRLGPRQAVPPIAAAKIDLTKRPQNPLNPKTVPHPNPKATPPHLNNPPHPISNLPLKMFDSQSSLLIVP